jgi:hypothetical protein
MTLEPPVDELHAWSHVTAPTSAKITQPLIVACIGFRHLVRMTTSIVQILRVFAIPC